MSDWQRIALERTGGFAGVPVRVQVGPEDDDSERWTGLLAGVDLDRLGPAAPGAASEAARSPAADRFSYALTIEAGGAVHDLRCGETALPQALRPLVEALVRRARSTGRRGE